MITISLEDPMLDENVDAILSMRKLGVPDREIEALYERQLELDREASAKADE